MATRVPLVTTRVGQAADLVRHGENGWMVEPEDVDGLVEWTLHVAGAARSDARARPRRGPGTRGGLLLRRPAAALAGVARRLRGASGAVMDVSAARVGQVRPCGRALGAAARGGQARSGTSRLLRLGPRSPAPGERVAGGTAKLQKLAARWPNRRPTSRCSTSGRPTSRATSDRSSGSRGRRGARIVVNQDGVGVPGVGRRADGRAQRAAPPRAARGRPRRSTRASSASAPRTRSSASRAASWEILPNAVDVERFTPAPPPADGPVVLLGGDQTQAYRLELAPRDVPARRSTCTRRRGSSSAAGSSPIPAPTLAPPRRSATHVDFVGAYAQRDAPDVFRRAHVLLHTKVQRPVPDDGDRGDGVRRPRRVRGERRDGRARRRRGRRRRPAPRRLRAGRAAAAEAHGGGGRPRARRTASGSRGRARGARSSGSRSPTGSTATRRSSPALVRSGRRRARGSPGRGRASVAAWNEARVTSAAGERRRRCRRAGGRSIRAVVRAAVAVAPEDPADARSVPQARPTAARPAVYSLRACVTASAGSYSIRAPARSARTTYSISSPDDQGVPAPSPSRSSKAPTRSTSSRRRKIVNEIARFQRLRRRAPRRPAPRTGPTSRRRRPARPARPSSAGSAANRAATRSRRSGA